MSPAATDPTPNKMRVFIQRLVTTLLLWSVLVFAFYLNDARIVGAIVALFGLATTLEYCRLMRRSILTRSYLLLTMTVGAVYWAAVVFWLSTRGGSPPFWLDLAAVAAVAQGSFLLSYRHELAGAATLQRIFTNIFGIVYTLVFFSFLVRMMFAATEGAPNVYMILYLVMVTKFCDMGAYAFGIVFGRHKMIPHISPGKSWEGFGGAFVGGFVGAAILLASMPRLLQPLDWLSGLLAVPLLCVAGVAGDLAESVLKRCTSTKDSGHALPGIGGVLDLTDSILFTAPVFYFYLLAVRG